MFVYRKEHNLSLTFLPVTFNEVMVLTSQYLKHVGGGFVMELTVPKFCPSSKWQTTINGTEDLLILQTQQLEIFLDILMKAETKLSKFEFMDVLNGIEIELAILVLIKNNSVETLQTAHIAFMQEIFLPILELKKEKIGRELFGEHYRKYVRVGKDQYKPFRITTEPTQLWPGILAYFEAKFESPDEFYHFKLLLEVGKPSPYPFFKLKNLSLRNFIVVFRVLMKENSIVLSKSEVATWVSRNFRFKNGDGYTIRKYRRIYDLFADKSLDYLEQKIKINQDLK